ncbi:MAG: DNA polymerase I [Bacillota bacterium]
MYRDLFLIIDGNSLAHRAYHAIPALSTSRGVATNAVYGFTNMLLKVLADLRPQLVTVAFDKGPVTFRISEFSDYKAHRKATPDDLRSQFPLLKEVLRAMRIPMVEVEGYEADDIIGAMTRLAENSGRKSIVLSGDRDTLQLVSPHTRVLLTKKGITETEEYDEHKVFERYGITPSALIDLKGLMGDASDNIPGIPGVGEKTALVLLKDFNSVEEVVARAEDLPSRLRQKVAEYGEQALMSKKLATIEREVPLDINIDSCIWPGPDYPELLSVFSRLEFKTLVRKIMSSAGGQEESAKSKARKGKDHSPGPDVATYHVDCLCVTDDAGAEELLEEAEKEGRVALALAGDRKEGLAAAAVAMADKVYYLPDTGKARLLGVILEICSNPRIEVMGHDIKNQAWLLHPHGGRLVNVTFDPMLAAYLLNPASPNQGLADLALECLGIVLPLEGNDYLTTRAHTTARLAGILTDKLIGQDSLGLFRDVELPLALVLAGMEIAGVTVNPAILESMAVDLEAQIESAAEQIHGLAGEDFNINSTRQLGVILFEKLGLPVIKRTKTGYSTDAGVLEELAGAHPIMPLILEYRSLVKLKSTYVDGLRAIINPDTGRIHTTFHQTVTATGRLSSAEPNLQNIPIRLEQGRRIRKVFVPRDEENLILSADYSQIELRVLAHMAGDDILIEAFKEGQDIHTRTASEVFGVPLDQVTGELRNRAKAVNFGIVYGISDFGLSRDIRVSRAEARRYIESYFNRYRGVKNYIDNTIAEARDKGYVTTLLNRRRYLPDLFSSNRITRNFGERAAINTPIQGSAADIIKLAMIRLQKELDGRSLKAKMVLQVHDELIFDVPAGEIQEMRRLVRECMENAVQLKVPLVVDIKMGPSWYDVKKT